MARGPLVTTDWLAAHLGRPHVRVVDATWFLPTERRDARSEFLAGHVPGAVFFDLDAVADRTTDLPHMLPPPEEFSAAVGALGISNADQVVVYDAQGIVTAPRAWWTFRAFGHADVVVLDGGLPKWRREGRPVATGPAPPAAAPFTARLDPTVVRTLADLRANLASRREQVFDARPAARFRGEAPEPRPGLRGGHIPGGRNVPFTAVVDPRSATLRPAAELAALFAAAGLAPDRPVVTTCGSGVTAAVLALALDVIGRRDVALYDGSWAEWGRPGDTPVATGDD